MDLAGFEQVGIVAAEVVEVSSDSLLESNRLGGQTQKSAARARPNSRPFPWVTAVDHFSKVGHIDPRVVLGRTQLGMPKQLLNLAQTRAPLQHVCSTGMA